MEAGLDREPDLIVADPLDIGPISRAGGQDGPTADAYLRAFHERHVPMTPNLASSLAALLEAGQAAKSEPWPLAFHRIAEVMDMARLSSSRLWRFAGSAFVDHVAEPVVRRAAVQEGAIQLFGAAPLQPGGSVARYEAYAKGIEQEVRHLLSGLGGMGRGFWLRAGLALYGQVIRSAQSAGGGRRRRRAMERLSGLAPEPDLRSARILFDIEPVFEPSSSRRRLPRRPKTRSVRERAGFKPKEGGVSGVRGARGVEDLSDILVSEFATIEEVVLMKIVHEGYLARKRPPFLRPRRDLLTMMIAPEGRRSDPERLLKAAWVDAMLRLRILLAQGGFPDSDLAWAESSCSGIRAAASTVGDLPHAFGMDPWNLPRQVWSELLLQSGLLPDILDMLPEVQLKRSQSDRPGRLREHVAEALRRASTPQWRPGASTPSSQRQGLPNLVLDDYGVVFCAVAQPRSITESRSRAPSWANERTRLRDDIGMPPRRGTFVCLALCPPKLDQGEAFTLHSDLRSGEPEEILISTAEEPEIALGETLGALSQWMVTATLEAVDAG